MEPRHNNFRHHLGGLGSLGIHQIACMQFQVKILILGRESYILLCIRTSGNSPAVIPAQKFPEQFEDA